MKFRFILPFLALAVPAAAQVPPIATEGLRVANQWCANCHAVSRNMRPPTGDATPTFPALAGMASTTETSLRVFLQTTHANRPDYQINRPQMDALVGYILSLKP